MNGFLYWCNSYCKKIGAYIGYELIVRLKTNLNLIQSTYIKSKLAIESLAILILLTLSVWSNTTTLKHLAPERCFDVVVFTLNKQNTEIMKAN